MSAIVKKGIQGLSFFSFGSSSVEPKPKPVVIDEDEIISVQEEKPMPKKSKNKTLQISGASGPESSNKVGSYLHIKSQTTVADLDTPAKQ